MSIVSAVQAKIDDLSRPPAESTLKNAQQMLRCQEETFALARRFATALMTEDVNPRLRKEFAHFAEKMAEQAELSAAFTQDLVDTHRRAVKLARLADPEQLDSLAVLEAMMEQANRDHA